ncbi:MAG: hypothetical protein HY677_05350 [Chloroflexi bacterium]|nr:hypothetical protein [Chloroflexota bacterium]
MKRAKRACLAIVVSLFLLLAFAATVTASGPKKFQASAPVAVTSPGTVRQIGPTFFTEGERIDGVIQSSDWDDIEDAAFSVVHNSVVTIDPATLRIVAGSASGTFTLTRPDGKGTLHGSYQATISGVLTCLISPLPCAVDDAGVWQAAGGTGEFEGVRAQGNWQGHLDGASLAGLSGSVQLNGRLLEKKSKHEEHD